MNYAYHDRVELFDALEGAKAGAKIKFFSPDSRSVLSGFESATVRKGRKAGQIYRMNVSRERGENIEQIITTEAQLAGWSITHTQGAVFALWLPDAEGLTPFKGLPIHSSDLPGERFIVTLVEGESGEEREENADKGPYGRMVAALHRAGFFHAPAVLRAIGTDADYQAWCRRQPCIICGHGDWVEQIGEERCDYAHVRRAGGSGTGIKAEFSGVPMHPRYHRDYQHHRGELAAYMVRFPGREASVQDAKEWFNAQAAKHRAQWAHEALAQMFGTEGLSHVPPADLAAWAWEHGLTPYLPRQYREAQ